MYIFQYPVYMLSNHSNLSLILLIIFDKNPRILPNYSPELAVNSFNNPAITDV